MRRILFAFFVLFIVAGTTVYAQSTRPKQLSVKEFLKLSPDDTTSYIVKGTVSRIRSVTSGSFYLQDKTGTLLVYGLQDNGRDFSKMDIVKGDTLVVLGRFTIYGGSTKEMKDGRLIYKADGPEHNLSFYDRLDQKPSFKGKEGSEGLVAFKQWVQAHVKKPAGKEKGQVKVSFVVGRNGGVQEVLVEEGASEALNREAVRVVESAPKWKPGVMDGNPVRITFYITVNFN